MNRGARPGGQPYRSRQYDRPAYRDRPPGRGQPPPARKPPRPKSSKYSKARKGAKNIPSIIGVVASITTLVDWILDKIAPKHYDFVVNDKVIFREDSDDPDIERSSIPVYRVCKLGSAENTFNLWDPLEKRVVAEDIDGHCLEKARKR